MEAGSFSKGEKGEQKHSRLAKEFAGYISKETAAPAEIVASLRTLRLFLRGVNGPRAKKKTRKGNLVLANR